MAQAAKADRVVGEESTDAVYKPFYGRCEYSKVLCCFSFRVCSYVVSLQIARGSFIVVGVLQKLRKGIYGDSEFYRDCADINNN